MKIQLISALLAIGLVPGGSSAGSSPRKQADPPAQTVSPSSPYSADSDFEQTHRLLQQGKYDEALAALRDLETRHPAMKGLSHELGVAYYKKSDYLNAVGYLKKAREENADDGESIQLLALSYYFSGTPAEAPPALEKFQPWFPSANVHPSYILGICYIPTQDYP